MTVCRLQSINLFFYFLFYFVTVSLFSFQKKNIVSLFKLFQIKYGKILEVYLVFFFMMQEVLVN